jgi:hypothetical protein
VIENPHFAISRISDLSNEELTHVINKFIYDSRHKICSAKIRDAMLELVKNEESDCDRVLRLPGYLKEASKENQKSMAAIFLHFKRYAYFENYYIYRVLFKANLDVNYWLD